MSARQQIDEAWATILGILEAVPDERGYFLDRLAALPLAWFAAVPIIPSPSEKPIKDYLKALDLCPKPDTLVESKEH